MKKIRVEFIQGLENKISDEELIKQLKIGTTTASRILYLEIARSIYQGFSVPQIAERLHKSSISIMEKNMHLSKIVLKGIVISVSLLRILVVQKIT
ncbi:hypothetical protein F6335_RS12640 [Enterococcus hirae]